LSGSPSEAGGPGSFADDLAITALALARRFAAGATLWCYAPDAAFHAHHVAVEFVHPVIMGKRALPAVALDSGADAASHLRPAVRAGDVVVAIAGGDDARVGDLVRRCVAWGVDTIWIATGDRPASGAANHVLVVGPEAIAVAGEQLVRAYHLLWELTHVCFEHPGLLKVDDECSDDVCITCSDEGAVAEVESVDGDSARVRTARGRHVIDTSLIDQPSPGDLLLVHAGSAITALGATQ